MIARGWHTVRILINSGYSSKETEENTYECWLSWPTEQPTTELRNFI